jgi:glycosyltransferase involved in cell wall biosynthesis
VARTICIIPAYDEAGSLPAVLRELRRDCPAIDVVVVDDGSNDDTASIAAALDVPVIRFSQRLGIGNAIRAGLRYAVRAGYTSAVRIDGDGQHQASDIKQLLGPVVDGRIDVVFGSRYTTPGAGEPGMVGLCRRLLALCLSIITGRVVTDPTSGFCAFGQQAMRLLAEQHPTGYPEPELLLLLNRCGLSVMELPVARRPRLAGHTSLTPTRVATAAARVTLAMIIVPLRRPAGEPARD